MDFSRTEAIYGRLKAQYEANALTEDEFKAKLQELMIQDEDGLWWMIGHETGQWYFHDGSQWVRGEPPRPAPPTGSVQPQQPEAAGRVAGGLHQQAAVDSLTLPEIRSRMQTAKIVLLVILLLAYALVTMAFAEDGFVLDTFVWLLAAFTGTAFWFVSERLTAKPEENRLTILRLLFWGFVVLWPMATIATLAIWAEIYWSTIVAVILCGVATYFMNRLASDGRRILDSQGLTS